ncbi:MAG: SDR family oxidoreductase [Actinomycetota bacterium]|nr:SDR family oxidoreductase [Actinomycetota bacterium]MDH5312251.1 SDR family oxidoreductase [Actinomycetota bacterium]
MQLDGKVAIISGGGSGIGAATARMFASEGAKVVVTGRRPDPIAEVAAATGGVAVAGDASIPTHAEEAVQEAVRTFGGLDIVVANAGVGFGGSAGTVTDDVWRTTIDINLSGALYLVRAAMPHLEARGGGSIVLVSSVSGFHSSASSAAYVASKAGMIGLAKSIAVDGGPRGIRANALCPGWVHTPMGDESMDELAAERGVTRDEAYLLATELVPFRRAGTADEVASCAVFLASDDSSYVSGTTLVVDGGGTAVDVASVAFDDVRDGGP